MYIGNGTVYIYEDTSIGGNLDVGPNQAQTPIKAYFNHAGSTGHIRIEGRYRDQGFLHFETNYQYGEMLLLLEIPSLLDVAIMLVIHMFKHVNH